MIAHQFAPCVSEGINEKRRRDAKVLQIQAPVEPTQWNAIPVVGLSTARSIVGALVVPAAACYAAAVITAMVAINASAMHETFLR
jgi:hypothetical protein